MSDEYNSGLLNDFGGGNVQWWHDYLRAEIEACNEFHHEIEEQLEAEVKHLRDALSHTRTVLTSNQPETLATWPGRRMTEAVAIIDKALKGDKPARSEEGIA